MDFEESEMKRRYFDAAATTPLDQSVQEKMVANFHNFGNENVAHFCGQMARKKMDKYMEQIAACLKVPAKIFLSCTRRQTAIVARFSQPRSNLASRIVFVRLSNTLPSPMKFLPITAFFLVL